MKEWKFLDLWQHRQQDWIVSKCDNQKFNEKNFSSHTGKQLSSEVETEIKSKFREFWLRKEKCKKM